MRTAGCEIVVAVADVPETTDHAGRSSAARRVAGVVVGRGGRIGSTVYGTILVMASLAAAYPAERHDPKKLVELVVSAVLVFWLAFVYAQALSETIESGSNLSGAGLRDIADKELGIVLAAVVPVLALVLGATGIVSESTSLWLAIAVGLATLFAQGYRYSLATRMGWLGTVAILVANLAFGLCIVFLKVEFVH